MLRCCIVGYRTKNMNEGAFKPGHDERRNMGGRPKCARNRAIDLVDEICGNEENLDILRKCMQEEFLANPMRFFRTIIVPLAPKEAAQVADPTGFAAMTPAEAAAAMDEATMGVEDAK